ncbi:MAG TPA: peptidylprolyl isomerase [Longimicrobium sp.]|nr:peptidylprolyl isomerase [Longimicrobium sp.]
MRTAFVLLLSLAAAPLVARPAHAQPGEELWDGVVAVVGDTVLLRSDLALFLEQVRAQGNQAVPEEGPALDAFLANLVEERVSDLLLLEGARASGLAVANEEIQLAVDEQLREVRARFPTEAAYAQALREAGRTPETYRAELARQFADQTLVQRFIRQATQQMAPPAVSDAEVRAFFTANRERFGTRPASISFQQVIVRPLPNDSARAAALRTAEQVQRELTEGVEFEVLARRYGTDGTRERGGDLGWFRQGQMVRSFDQVVFAMRPGTTSGIVETEFGFHIIKLERARGPERQARHILIRPEITQADIDRARQRADSVAAAIRAGASAPDLAARYETPDAARFQSEVPLDRLPPAFVSALESAQPGTVAGPLQVENGPNPAFAVLRVTARRTAGDYTAEEQRERIVQMLREQKLLERLLADLRRDTYISVRM